MGKNIIKNIYQKNFLCYNTRMKTFNLKFSNLIVILAYAGVAVCVAAFALNVWRFVKDGGFTDFYATIQYLIIFGISLFAPVLLLCVVHNSRYIITETEFITAFGFIKSKFPISDMTKAIFNKATCQLAVYTGEEFMVFRLNEKWSKEFIDLLLSKGKIIYDEVEDFEPDEDKKDEEKDKK